jgi:hypothetical protein
MNSQNDILEIKKGVEKREIPGIERVQVSRVIF